MTEELTQKRTPELIGAEIRMYVDTGRRITLLCGIEIGRRLKEAKEMLPHGEWLPWLERETEFSTSSASRYIQAFEQYGAAQLGLFGPETNFPALGNLSITKALALLAVPEGEREQFAEEHDVENMSTRELEQAIKDKKAAEERAAALEKELAEIEDGHELALAELTDQVNELRSDAAKGKEALKERSGLLDEIEKAQLTEKELRNQIHDLENRPIATVKERDEQAIEEAVQKAKADAAVEWSEKTAKLTQELEKAKTAADKLKAKADKADAGAAEKVAAAEAEAEKLRRELEAARKAAKLSDANVTAFSIHFKAFQETAQALFAALGKIADADISTAAKLAGGVEQLFSRYKTQTGEIKERAAKAPLSGQTEMGG